MDRLELVKAFREQAGWCERLGSPLYHAIMLRIAGDVDSSGISWSLLESHSEDSPRSLTLRFLGAVHRLVLEGRAPGLARYYPSVGGTADSQAAWTAFVRVLEEHGDLLRNGVPQTVQTNEVARCCALLPGFLEIARRTALPLRLLEIGCSAGLNLRWDCYRYETSRGAWGPPDSPVVFRDPFLGDPPPLGQAVCVTERTACDLNPVDPASEDGRLTLLSFVWPDQMERFRVLSRAIEVARTMPAVIRRANAVDWLESELASLPNGSATVVFHSIVLPYLDDPARDQLSRILNEAGERATNDSPLAWLSMEPGENEADVHLTLWPGGSRRRIAKAGYHGRNVECTR
ncbi:MAG: DUF2332 domain-containing protein [Candidatus Solibacter usitatus]|nr:DUF2332 domain-containing protein [Candidatus Solibacter usitatus]